VRSRHPKKEVEEAVQYAIEAGWELETLGGHSWGVLRCPEHSRAGCQVYVYSTPQNPGNHAKQLKGAINRCEH
jgi:hypothetical protein